MYQCPSFIDHFTQTDSRIEMLKCEVPKEFNNSRTSDVGAPAEGVLPYVHTCVWESVSSPQEKQTPYVLLFLPCTMFFFLFFFFLAQIKRNTKADHLGRSNECSVKMAGFTNFLDSGGRYFTLWRFLFALWQLHGKLTVYFGKQFSVVAWSLRTVISSWLICSSSSGGLIKES